MWTIIKINSKRILELKKDFYKKLGNEVRFYQPKFKIEKIKNNKIINYEKNLFGDYLFCYHEKFKKSGFNQLLIYSKGLKYFLDGSIFYQKEISKVIERCKEQEDDSGFLQHNFLNYLSQSEIKIFKGPLRNMVFDIIEKKKNKLSFIFGNLKATITNQGI